MKEGESKESSATEKPLLGVFHRVFESYNAPKGSDWQTRESRYTLLWILGSIGGIMLLVVSLVAYMAIKRSEADMAKLLAEKGASLLMVFESALKTGMKAPSGLQLQPLLQEITKSPDIQFVAVTMPDGVILAHSDSKRIGKIMGYDGKPITEEELKDLAPKATEKWRVTRSEGRRVFLLYRQFTLDHQNWPKDVPKPYIFLGMDVSPFEITNSQNRDYITMLCIVMLLVGLTCLLAFSYAQRAAESRRRQRLAEREVSRLEQEVRRQETLAAVGTLAAGVAHEIRNPLSSIKGYAVFFSQLFPEGSNEHDAAQVMVNEVNRLNRVITDLLDLSKPGNAKVKPVRIENVVAHVLRLISPNCTSHKIEVVFRIAPKIPDIMADVERLCQALLNLCLNAIESMPDGGTLTIAVAGGHDRICLMVRDTGIGMDKETLAKIFDPYFTTKASGTGLGLLMVHKIVRAHKGEIDVKSHVMGNTSGYPQGTIFRIWLPAVRHRLPVFKP